MTVTRHQRKSSPEESRQIAGYDLACALYDSSAASRICHDNSMVSGLDCVKQCYIHSELCQCLANISVATGQGYEAPKGGSNLDFSGMIQIVMRSAKTVSDVCGSHKNKHCHKCAEHANHARVALETYQGILGKAPEELPSTPKKAGRARKGTIPSELEAKEE